MYTYYPYTTNNALVPTTIYTTVEVLSSVQSNISTGFNVWNLEINKLLNKSHILLFLVYWR